MTPTPEQLARIWSRIKKGGDDECWPWVGKNKVKGYGRISLNNVWWLAHRLIWTILKGPIPEGKQVLHSCDNRLCCNIKHMFLGTNYDNMKDKSAKLRQPHGVQAYQAKLTVEQVHEIRLSTQSYSELTDRYGVSKATISRIKSRKIYRHV